MKVLDPFSGYRLASGHPIFHISLFIGSFMVVPYEKGTVAPVIQQCFDILRWSHFTLFMLALISVFSKLDSEIPEREPKENLSQKQMLLEE